MPGLLRIDESQAEFLVMRQEVTEILCDITNLINKQTWLNKTSTRHKIEESMGLLKEKIGKYPDNKMLVELLSMSLGNDSTFDKWYTALPNDAGKAWLGAVLPLTLILGKKIHPSDAATIDKMHSRWFYDQPPEVNGTANQIEEFIRSEIFFLHSITPVKIILNSYLKYADTQDKELINQYIASLSKLESDFKALNLDQIFQPEDQSIEAVITKLCDAYQSKAFDRYQNNIQRLSSLREPILHLETKYAQKDLGLNTQQKIELNQYISPIFQRATRYSLMYIDLQREASKNGIPVESIHKIQTAFFTSETRLAITSGQEQMISQKLPNTSEQKKAAVFQALSKAEFTTEASYTGEQRQKLILIQQASYIESLLCAGFPNIFSRAPSNHALQTKSREMYDALGISIDPKTQSKWIDPAQFNTEKLKSLFATSHDPLWLVLRIIKPIDELYTLEEKIAAYYDVIEQVKAGNLQLGNQTTEEQIVDLAAQALQLIEQELSKDPNQETPELRAVIHNIRQSIEPTLLARAYRKLTPQELERNKIRDAYRTLDTKTVYQNILSFESLTTLNQDSQSLYLERLLIEAFPDIFERNDQTFQAKERDEMTVDTTLIPKALGIASGFKKIHPTQFNVTRLNKFITQAREPIILWHLLKAIIPINNQPTSPDQMLLIENKIEAYFNIILALKAGTISIDSQSTPMQQARTIALHALNIVKNEEKRTGVSPLQKNPALRDVMQNISNTIRSTATESIAKGAAHLTSRENNKTSVRREYEIFLGNQTPKTTQQAELKQEAERLRTDSEASDNSTKSSSSLTSGSSKN